MLTMALDITERQRAEEALRASEEQLRLITDALPVVISYVDAGQCYRFNNLAYEQWFGTPRSQIVGKHLREVLGEPAYQVAQLYVERVLSGEHVTFESTVPYMNGGARDVSAAYIPKLAEDGSVEGFYALVRDITASKQAEQALRASEARFSTVFHASPLSIAILRLEDDQFVDVNEAWEKLTGHSRSEAIGCTPHHLEIWDDPRERESLIEQMHAHGAVVSSPVELRRKSGESVDTLLSAELIELAGEPCMLSMALDVTENRRAERALRESEVFVKDVLDSLTSNVAVLDEHGVVVAVNEGWKDFARQNGCQDENYYLGVDYLDICDRAVKHDGDQDAATALKGIREVLAGWQDDFRLEYPCHSPDVLRWFLLRASRLRGAQRGVVVAHHNITERKLIEQQLEKSLNEKTVLLREVHHRVKNNLDVILSLADLQARRLDDPKSLESLRLLQERIRAIALVHESIYRSPELATINARPYLSRLTDNIFLAFGFPGVELRLAVDEIDLKIDTAIPCGLIVSELVTNALKHAFPLDQAGVKSTPGGGAPEIAVMMTEEIERITLQVSDNGVGMPPDQDWENSRSFGMRLVGRLVQQLHATLEIECDHGCVVRIEIPVIER
jgi:PAS domain S-box-containing protein